MKELSKAAILLTCSIVLTVGGRAAPLNATTAPETVVIAAVPSSEE